MFQTINDIIAQFRECFKREKTWRWFACIILGFMVRGDHRGVTSTITALRLKPGLYHALLNFYRSSAYKVVGIYRKWMEVVLKYARLLEVGERLVMLGDHIKIGKEGRRMPCVQKHHQSSGNSGKGEYIEGHNFGQVSAIITDGVTSRAIPLIAQMQESATKTGGDSLIVQMVKLGGETAKSANKPGILVLDAYFYSGTAFKAADEILDDEGKRRLEIITRAKSNAIAYREPEKPAKPKAGRPRKYGEKVVVADLFEDSGVIFNKTKMILYGKVVEVEYLCRDLIWRSAGRKIRFVLAKTGTTKIVLMSSDLTMASTEIIDLYAKRYKIEPGFDDQKNDMGNFSYHFWTKSLPKRKRGGDTQSVSDPKARRKIQQTKQAVEIFVCLGLIATGILSIIGFSYSRDIWNRYPGYIKTIRSRIPSVATVKLTISQDFHDFLPLLSHLKAFAFIPKLQRLVAFLYQRAA